MSNKESAAVHIPAPAEAKPAGRPSTFAQAVADEICERLAKGEPLEKICRDAHMPSSRTVLRWKGANKEFRDQYACAREEGFDTLAAECLEIADDGTNDTYVDEQGNRRVDAEVIQRSKLRIETRLKLLAKWDPKRYGDKVDLNHGGQGGNPLDMNFTVQFVSPGDVE